MLDHPGPFSEAHRGPKMAQNSTKMAQNITKMAQNITKMAHQDPKCPYMTPNGPKTLPMGIPHDIFVMLDYLGAFSQAQGGPIMAQNNTKNSPL